MSRDPLEGVRSPDSLNPAAMRPHDALDQPLAPPQLGIARPSHSPKMIIAIMIGTLCAVAGGAIAFYLAERDASPAPRPVPSGQPTAQPISNATGDVVRQGAAPPEAK
jgi:hypothetical protein